MEFIKINDKMLICFSAKELTELLLSKNNKKILVLAKNNLKNLRNTKKDILQIARTSANSKDYELWTGIFSLYEEFKGDCKFCFYLKDTFSMDKDTITTIQDLEKFKEENSPVDIAVLNKDGLHKFQLKRYRKKLTEAELWTFVEEKIIKHYSNALNFLIILQPKPGSSLSLDIFKSLHNRLIRLKLIKTPGKIFFHYNRMNKNFVFVEIFPEFRISERPFKKGSEQIKEIID